MEMSPDKTADYRGGNGPAIGSHANKAIEKCNAARHFVHFVHFFHALHQIRGSKQVPLAPSRERLCWFASQKKQAAMTGRRLDQDDHTDLSLKPKHCSKPFSRQRIACSLTSCTTMTVPALRPTQMDYGRWMVDKCERQDSPPLSLQHILDGHSDCTGQGCDVSTAIHLKDRARGAHQKQRLLKRLQGGPEQGSEQLWQWNGYCRHRADHHLAAEQLGHLPKNIQAGPQGFGQLFR